MRLAQFDWLKKHLKQTPILLLDDIFDKLDNQRVEQLMKLVSDNTFGQVFVSDTDFNRVNRIFETINIEPNIIEFKAQTV